MADEHKATITLEALSLNDDDVVPTTLLVGKTIFALDACDVTNLNSEFLHNLLGATVSPPESGIYEIPTADAECFSVMLHFTRFHVLVVPSCGEKKLLQQAEFWIVQPADRIRAALLAARNRLKSALLAAQYTFDRAVNKTMEKREEEIHHNQRESDGRGRIFCSDCGHRDIDSFNFPGEQLYVKGSKYTTCEGCNKMMECKPNLGWCHKCHKCDSCQSSKCPNDSGWNEGTYAWSQRNVKIAPPFQTFCEDSNLLDSLQSSIDPS